jgi:hypothetical protein
VTLAPRGLLIEEQRTNLSTYSVLASQWGAASNASYQNTQAIAPDGTASAWSLIEDTANSAHFGSMTSINASYTSGTVYTVSRYLKAAGRTTATVYLPATAFPTPGRGASFNLTLGTVSAETGVTATIQNVGNGWYRCTVTATASATASGHVGGSALETGNVYQGNGTSGILIWGHQLEAGAFATSYIPTIASQVTRALDVATMLGANFSNWYNQTEGTIYSECSFTAASQVVLAVSDGTSNHRMFTWANATTTNNFRVIFNSNIQADLYSTASLNSYNKQASAYATDNFAFAVNGGTVATDASGVVPPVNRLQIGSDPTSSSLSGTIKKIAYYNRRLANTELQGITS